MAVVADSGAVFGFYHRLDIAHASLRAAIEREREEIIIPSVCLGEIDYLLRSRLGSRALLNFLVDVDAGSFSVESVTNEDLRRCAAIIEKHSTLNLGLCDAAVAVIADRLGTDRIFTVDQPDFRVLRTFRGKPYRLLPADLK